ncbi:cupin domain-containing protein [Aestuariivirga sp.]|uniref:cupin domain-containing protein n=1 Tax=Aestuariivirga sp. TaxID=2650926 RepID=UPI00391B6598
MAEAKPAALRATDVAARTATIYPPPYAAALAGRAKRALGDAFGLSQFGVNLTVLAPGSASSERHWHETEDEFVYVLEGEVTLVDDTGEHLLTAGMCAGFRAGVPNGHKLVNRSPAPVTLLEVGTRSEGDRAHYPEADMMAVKENGKFRITRKDGTPY